MYPLADALSHPLSQTDCMCHKHHLSVQSVTAEELKTKQQAKIMKIKKFSFQRT